VDARELGRSGLAVSVVGLGGFELGSGDTTEGYPTLESAETAIRAALDSGMNWIDTAEAYFDSGNESFVGELLRKMRLGVDELMISSKLLPGPEGTGFRATEVHEGFRASLVRLGRTELDIYLLHAPDETGVPLEETWGAMSELVDDGLVKAIGLSNFTLDDVRLCHALRAVDVVQDGLSLIDHLDNREMFERCRELEIGVVVYEPLGSGTMSGKSLDSIREAWAEFAGWGFYKRLLAGENGDRSAALVDALRVVAAEQEISLPQLAIAWVLHQGGVTAALAGSANPDHVRANAAAAELELPQAVLGRLEELIPLGPTFGN
jgi:aryl-alcohol dehydrogenase-like predicted oxidoreductase